jgi:hypothetical protein
MPFMQRITWSGVALHEGENIGHPASHGCIRMPHDFAAKLWVVTKLGVRVIVARPELKPVEFADAHLFVHKIVPPPAPPAPPAPAAAAPPAPEPVKTAQTIDGDKATDASPAAPNPAPPAAVTGNEPAAGPAVAALPSPPPAAAAVAPEPVQTAQTIDGDKATDASTASTPAPPAAANGSDPAAGPAAAAPQAEPAKSPALPDAATALRPTLQADPPPAPAAQAVPVPPTKPAALVDAEAASHGPIAIFVSRKEKKVYVRQRFSPLFDAAITIDQPDRPLGTLIFTALEYLPDGATFRWNLVAMPAEPPKPSRGAKNDRQIVRYVRGRRVVEERVAAPVADPLPPQAPQEVLARIEIPQDVIDRISELMVPGSSLVVSDQGLGDETGGGTDFIVVTR